MMKVRSVLIVPVIVASGCSGPPPQDTLPPADPGTLSRQISETSQARPDAHPVYHYYLNRFRVEVIDLENRVTALHRAAANLRTPDKKEVENAIADFENLVQQSRTTFEGLEKQGPSTGWEAARDETRRAIGAAEDSFDHLALRYGVTKVEGEARK
jgi:hypothetical protein